MFCWLSPERLDTNARASIAGLRIGLTDPAEPVYFSALRDGTVKETAWSERREGGK